MRRLCLIVAACGAPVAPPAPGPVDEEPPSRDDVPLVVEPSGYAIHGVDVYPPLMRRVIAVPCEEWSGECQSDEDCGPGAACLCGAYVWVDNVCIPAECQTDDDCEPGPCFLSRGGTDRCPTGLNCAREGSTCEDGGDCPGNGTACTYVAPTDRFECSIPACR
jgi:hypothetical protein